jgi:hypothetical protein
MFGSARVPIGCADDVRMTKLDAPKLDRAGWVALGVAGMLLAVAGCTSAASAGSTASARGTTSVLNSGPVVTAQLDASQTAAAREFGVLLAQGDALGDSPNPQNSVGVGANDYANFAASKVLVMKAIVVLQSVSWPSNVAPDVQAWIAAVTKAEADVATVTALPAASATAGPGASALSATIIDLTAWSNAEASIRADFGLPPEESTPPSP